MQDLKIAGHTIVLSDTPDTDALYNSLLDLDKDHPHVQDERIPYWAELWPSAIALATHILEGERMDGGHVLEIGCGLGLPGIAAGLAGARVTFTDYLDDALEAARANWNLNLDEPATFLNLDWRHPPPGLRAELILASDVAYEKRSFQPLLEFFRETLIPGGRILLSEPGRKYAKAMFDSFDAAGFERRTFFYPVTNRGMSTQINVHEIRKG